MRTLFIGGEDVSAFDLQIAAVRLIQYLCVGAAVEALMLLLTFLSFQLSCEPCLYVTLWPSSFVALLTWPMCSHTAVACAYIGIVVSVPAYGLASYLVVRLVKAARKARREDDDDPR
jgi:hypothetical protein